MCIRDRINQGADLIIASRYILGGNTNGWSLWREIVSKGATLLAHLVFPKIWSVKDPLSGYFLFKRSAIVKTQLTGLGWKILLELLVKGMFKKVVEVPYFFKPRLNGESKLKPKDYVDYLRLILSLSTHKI